jgi:hypothetical protein
LQLQGHHRWLIEGGNAQLKTYLRGPGKVLRSGSPDLVKQEIWGYLLTHYTINALTCTAATAAGIDPDRVKFRRTVRILRRRVADPGLPLSMPKPNPVFCAMPTQPDQTSSPGVPGPDV